MREKLRNSGIDIIGDVPWGTHFCQFYHTQEDVMDIMVPYFKAGLENNELCVWIISQPLEVKEAKAAMKRAVPDIDVYLEKGQIEIVPYTHGYLKEGIFNPERVVNNWVEKIDQALARGYDGLRAAGDNRWLEKEGWSGFIDYENKVDAIIDKRHVIALCPYYLEMCSTDEVIDVISNHQFALIKREGKWERIENSGRKRAEKEAIQAAKNWEDAFDAVPDLIAIIDEKYRVIRANRAMKAKLGVTSEECAGLTCYRVIHGTDENPSFCPHRHLLKNGVEHTAEVCENCLGGYFAVSASPLHDSEGKLIGSIYVARDINERKKVEERFKESEEKYRNIVETANEGIFIIDSEARIAYSNKKTSEMLGYSLEEMIGRSLWDFVDEEGRAILNLNMEKRRQGINEVYELKLICKNGSPVWTLISAKALFNKVGEFTGSLGMLTDITDRKRAEEALRQSEQRVRLKLESIFSPSREIGNLELADIIDTQAIQSLMDDFYTLAYIPMSLIDLKGNVLAGVGWQDICTEFHRVHLETCKHCVESDTKLSGGVSPGEFKLYRCKNNMWDIATPIMVGGQHVGNIFSGQFFFEDEPLDYELFRAQARKYGFNEEEYIAALEKVPRLSREAVDTGMAFFMKLANMFSKLSYSNAKLARSLAERDTLVDALRESEKREQARSDELEAVLDAVPVAVFITHDPQVRQITGNRLSYEWLRVPVGTNFSKSAPEGERPEMFELFKDGREIPPENMPSQMAAAGREVNNCELDIVSADGKIRHVLGNARPLLDEQGKPRGSVSAFIDITERKKAEEAIRLSNLYNRSLIEASLDPLVTIGRDGKITDVNGATELITGYSRKKLIGTDFSDYFTEPEKARASYQQVFTHGEVRDYPLEIQHKDGLITPVLYNTSVYEDENGKVIGVFAAARDITERKKAEKALKKAHENLEEKVKERTAELEEAYNSLMEEERRLSEAQKIAHIGNWEWDIATDKAYWSEEMNRIFGRGPQESAPLYSEFLSYVHPEDRRDMDNAHKNALNGKSFNIEFRIVLANEEERTVHMQSRFIFNEKNIPVRLKGIVQDITERKEAEEKIRILADVVESSNDAIVTESLEGIITSWNKGAEQIYGYPAEEILGKNVSILEPDKLKGEIKQFIGEIKQGEKIKNYETLRLKKDGSTINVSLTLSPVFDSSGKLVAISAITRNITESKQAEEALRESEARLRRFYESNILGVFYYNLDGSVIDANNKLLEIVGYTREDFQAGRVNWDKMTPPEYSHLDEHAATELKALGVNTPYEKEYIRKDGSRVPVIVGVATFDKACNEGVAFVLDITERKKAEEALANIEIARKKEIHHRIKNNLQVISSLLDLQAEKFGNREFVTNSEVREAFRESQDRVISMAFIHEELHKSEGLDTLNFSPYIEELTGNLIQTYRLGNLNISLNMGLEENIFLDMDTAVPLGIIINELVSNSLKHAFIGRDKGEIRIRLLREKNDEHKKEGNKSTSFILTVSDNGRGIPENFDIEDFDSLGLQLVTYLVDQLDGELELKRDNGTEFTIRFTVTEYDQA
ncbi:sensory transduction histidine kinase [Methanosarcina siciliae C2J]|uniref:Sensory transduction histidine kinase n=1 Tax=Methanosarcina siciliae C2J TaxID=1434118 RepID=A0A0E3PM30_9EURY|nr:PAS domain S-box protein [Methanosarcina siciliae]AKB36495.1 sensory transduction histidine kinase [Methanosarcina siciliae C2J]